MRVGVDYLAAASHWPGTGRYARELVRALVARPDAPELALFDVGRAVRAVDVEALGLEQRTDRVRRVTRGIPRRALPALAALGFDAARLLGGVDVFHHVHADGPPVRRAAEVLALAELPAPGSAAHAALARSAQRLAAVVVFATDWRARVARELSLPLERVHATPVGCEHWRRALPTLPEPLDPPRVLVLGATHRARDPVRVLRAFEDLVASGVDARLVWCGRDGDAEDAWRAALARSPSAVRVERIRDAREHELPLLVARSAALVHLDPDAGTPVTPLEALALDVPVVVSRAPVFVEALDGVAAFADAHDDPRRLSARIAAAIAARTDSTLAAARAGRAARYTWDAAARATAVVWRGAAADQAPRLRPVQ